MRKLVCRDKESLRSKGKALHACQANKEFIFYLALAAGVQPSPGQQGGHTGNGYVRDKCHHSQDPPSFFFPQLSVAEHDVLCHGILTVISQV